MVAAPEKEGHPLIEQRIEDPGELEKIGQQEKQAETVLERVERNPGTQPVTDSFGQVVLTPSGSQQVTITLPLTEEEIKHGLHHKIVDAIYWLAKWCVRMVKKAALFGVRVVYKKN